MRNSMMRAKGQGVGPVHSFVCVRCGEPRDTAGRKYLAALRTYVCAGCAGPKAKTISKGAR